MLVGLALSHYFTCISGPLESFGSSSHSKLEDDTLINSHFRVCTKKHAPPQSHKSVVVVMKRCSYCHYPLQHVLPLSLIYPLIIQLSLVSQPLVIQSKVPMMSMERVTCIYLLMTFGISNSN
jgi:hypothetical protein